MYPDSNFFLRFVNIFQISLVIPPKPPLLFKELPMSRYRRYSFEDLGSPPLFSHEKPLLLPISHKKSPVNFFDTDAEKGVTYRKTRFQQKKIKRQSNVFCFKIEAIVHRYLPLEKLVKKWRIQVSYKKRQSVSSSSTLLMERNIVRQLDTRFLSFWLASWRGPMLTTCAINVERQRRKQDWRISSIIFKGSYIHQLKKRLWTRRMSDIVTPVENTLNDWLTLSSLTSMMHHFYIANGKHW